MSKDTIDPKVFDLRQLERNIKKGVITRKDYERFVKSLPDAKDKIATHPADHKD